jgi:hypothetical protein
LAFDQREQVLLVRHVDSEFWTTPAGFLEVAFQQQRTAFFSPPTWKPTGCLSYRSTQVALVYAVRSAPVSVVG